MSVKITTIESFENYGKCIKISNGTIDAIVTADIGPRILYFGFTGGENVLHLDLNRATTWDGELFDNYYYKGAVSYLYGGHRIWVTPESEPETYYPDNDPLEIEYTENGAIFTAPVQISNNIRISLEIKMADTGANMEVFNRVQNAGEVNKEFAVWTISVMCTGGLEIIPHNTIDAGYLHNRVISLWTYTNPNDYRFYNGKKYMTVKQDPAAPGAFKIGADTRCGTAIYAAKESVFIMRRDTDHDNLTYPDGGVSFETYTANNNLEFEMLDAVRNVAPGETTEFKECWSLVKNPGTPDARSDDEIDAFFKKVTEQ